MLSTGFLRLGLLVEELTDLTHFAIQGLDKGAAFKQLSEGLLLVIGEFFGAFAQGTDVAALVFDFRLELLDLLQEVMHDDAHGMEAVGDDTGIGEPDADHFTVRMGHVYAHHAHLVTASEAAQILGELRSAASLDHVEDLVCLQVAEGGHVLAVAVQGVLVDAQHRRTVLTLTLPGLALGEGRVGTRHRRCTDLLTFSHPLGADPVVVVTVDLFAQRLAAAVPRPDSRQLRHKVTLALKTPVTARTHQQIHMRSTQALMLHPALIAPLAVELPAATTGTLRGKLRRYLY